MIKQQAKMRLRYEMSEEREQILQAFVNHFSGFADRNMMLYGESGAAKFLLKRCPEYRILGVMDPETPENFDEIARLEIRIIVAVSADTDSPGFAQVLDYCRDRDILFYDTAGTDLLFRFGYMDFASEELLKLQIQRHDVISFDVFDTLIMRKSLYPEDVYEIVGDRADRLGIHIENFKDIRIKADEENPRAVADLYEIYEEVQNLTGISEEEKSRLIELEISVEKQAIVPRNKMAEIFRFAVAQEKRVYLISDMYLPEKILAELLQDLDISGYQGLLVSCEYKKTKRDELFSLYKQQAGGESFLHIGDNEQSDGLSARKNGIDAFLVKSAAALLCASPCGEVISMAETVNERSIVGLFAARLFNNPFSLYRSEGRAAVTRLRDLIYLFGSPLITGFAIWLAEQMRTTECSDILFAARDGFLIQKLYNIARNLERYRETPKGIYFQTSRSICAAAAMENESDIEWLAAREYAYSPDRMVKERFRLTDEDMLPYSGEEYGNNLRYALAHREKIYRSSSALRKNYLRYIEGLGLKAEHTYAFVDFVSSGTSQFFLSKIVPFKLKGFYFCRYGSGGDRDGRLSGVPIKAMFEDSQRYFTHYVWLEVILTSLKPSLSGMDESGEMEFAQESRSGEELRLVEELQQVVVEYFTDFVGSLFVPGLGIDRELPRRLLSFIGSGYIRESSGFFDTFSLKDDFEQNSVYLTF